MVPIVPITSFYVIFRKLENDDLVCNHENLQNPLFSIFNVYLSQKLPAFTSLTLSLSFAPIFL